MNYNEALQYIHYLGMFSHKPSLERIHAVLERLGNPQRDFSVIHAAGTNGKGSVCVMTASVLTAAGFKTGLFVSPYIVNFRERIQIDGEYISEEELCRLAQSVKEANVPLTEFEFITALAFLHFSRQGCQLVVLETGLGGRLDATNACENDIVDIICNIGLDHTEILGGTISEIAAEKCGIIKCQGVVTAPFQDSAALSVIKKHCDNVIVPDTSRLNILASNISGSRFLYKNQEYSLTLAGKHQIYNAVTVIEALSASGLSIPQGALKQGLLTAFIPARLEILSTDPLFLIDGAHNPHAAEVLYEFMREYSGSVVAVFSAMRDKDYPAVAKRLFPLCKGVVLTELSQLPRAESLSALRQTAERYCGNVRVAESPAAAVKAASSISNGGPVFAFGSLYLAAEIRRLFKSR